MSEKQLTLDIQPPVSVYATFRRLSYLPWYAIAEFVDNSTQNYYEHKHELKEAYKSEEVSNLRIEIEFNRENNSLTIRDNANGMDSSELDRSVKLNRPPQNCSGRCEFGMGLKTAACWFGRKWKIETTRYGAHEKYTVNVDVDELSEQNNEILIVDVQKLDPSKHYTILTIDDLYKPINGRTSQRIKDQLSSMYREDLRSGEIEILWNGVPLEFKEPPILEEELPNGQKVIWKKRIKIEVPWESHHQLLPVEGWIGIRIPASQRDAGFVLLRRGRVIIGGPEKGYRPVEIFGQPNSFSYQRLIGELNLDNWPVSQAKDTFDWSGGLEDKFIEILKEYTKDYCDKAEGHREKNRKISKEDMEEAAKDTKKIFESKELSTSVGTELTMPSHPQEPEKKAADLDLIEKASEGPIVIQMQLQHNLWVFKLFWQNQLSDANWMSVEFPQENEIHIFLNANHPFFDPYLKNIEMISLIQRFVMSLALAEKMARSISSNNQIEASDFRNYMNWVLRYVGKLRGDKNA